MKKLISLLKVTISIALIVSFSCKKNDITGNTCNADDPLKELEWLKTEVQYLEQSGPGPAEFFFITMARFRGETVFVTGNCDPTANYISPVKNCSGELIGTLGAISPDSLLGRRVIWKLKNSACSF